MKLAGMEEDLLFLLDDIDKAYGLKEISDYKPSMVSLHDQEEASSEGEEADGDHSTSEPVRNDLAKRPKRELDSIP